MKTFDGLRTDRRDPGVTSHSMRATVSPHVQVKAAGGIRTLMRFLTSCRSASRESARRATETMLEDYKARKSALAFAVSHG